MADEPDTTATPNSETTTPAATTDVAGGAPADAGATGGNAGDAGGSPGGDAGGGDPLDAPGILDGVEAAKDGDASADASKDGEAADGADGADAGEKAGEDAPLTGEVPDTYDIAAPEGVTLDKAALDMFDPVFRKLGLTNAGAQEMVNAAPAFVEHVRSQVADGVVADVVAVRAQWAKDSQNDPEIGGARFEESKALAAKAFDRLGFAPDGAFRSFLKETGLGNHPEMIRAMTKMGRAIGEDGFERGEGGKADTPIWDRVYGGPTN